MKLFHGLSSSIDQFAFSPPCSCSSPFSLQSVHRNVPFFNFWFRLKPWAAFLHCMSTGRGSVGWFINWWPLLCNWNTITALSEGSWLPVKTLCRHLKIAFSFDWNYLKRLSCKGVWLLGWCHWRVTHLFFFFPPSPNSAGCLRFLCLILASSINTHITCRSWLLSRPFLHLSTLLILLLWFPFSWRLPWFWLRLPGSELFLFFQLGQTHCTHPVPILWKCLIHFKRHNSASFWDQPPAAEKHGQAGGEGNICKKTKRPNMIY